jgi:hypothetical protein
VHQGNADAAEPVVEPDLPEFCFIAGEERERFELGTEIACVRVCDHLTQIVARSEVPLNESVQVKVFGPADFNRAIQWTAGRDSSDGTSDVVSRNGLDEHWRHANSVAVRRGIGDAALELEALRRLDDRVRGRRVFDQRLLRKLRPEVAASEQTWGAHDGHHDVMTDPRGRLTGEKVVC